MLQVPGESPPTTPECCHFRGLILTMTLPGRHCPHAAEEDTETEGCSGSAQQQRAGLGMGAVLRGPGPVLRISQVEPQKQGAGPPSFPAPYRISASLLTSARTWRSCTFPQPHLLNGTEHLLLGVGHMDLGLEYLPVNKPILGKGDLTGARQIQRTLKSGGGSGVWNSVSDRGNSICKDSESGRNIPPQSFLFYCLSASIRHTIFCKRL